MRQIILDTETTGISVESGHRVIEIGMVEIIERRFTGNDFQAYLNSQRKIDPATIIIQRSEHVRVVKEFTYRWWPGN